MSHKIKNLLREAYSSVVERTAHNGLVVGSNPTKPKYSYMDFNLQTYKRHKIKEYFQKLDFFFFCYSSLLNNNCWTQIEQNLTSLGLRHHYITNKLIIQAIRNSIFTNLTVIIHASILLLHCNSLLIYKELKNVNSLFLLSLKLNNKIYSKRQLQNLKKISYVENVLILHNSVKLLTQLSFCNLKKMKTISK